MLTQAPFSYHLDLYRYWLAKRGSRAMPARRDIDAADIPALLPYLGIVDKVAGQVRYRLVGSDIVRQYGRELTGSLVGSHLRNAPEAVAKLRAIGERVFITAHPIFITGQYETECGSVHNSSALILPLSDDGATVNMLAYTRIARFSLDAVARIDWLKGAPIKLIGVVDVDDVEGLEKLCLEWEERSDSQRPRAEARRYRRALHGMAKIK
jgi:hypothetical protein